MAARPWDQLKDESDNHYFLFLIYRNLGPGRTLTKAHRFHQKEIAGRDTAPASPGGVMKEACRTHRWPERAIAWDVWNLQLYGAHTAVCYVMALRNIARRAFAMSKTAKPGTQEWRDLVTAMKELGPRFDIISGRPQNALVGHESPEPADDGDGQPVPPEGSPALPGHDPDGPPVPPGSNGHLEDPLL